MFLAKKTVLMVLSCLIILNGIPVMAAAADVVGQPSIGVETAEALPPTLSKEIVVTVQDERLANALTDTYQTTITKSDVAALHASGLGYGEVSKAYGLAALSGKSVADIVAMKQTAGWGEMALSLGVKVSDFTRSEKAVEQSLQHANQTSGKAAGHNSTGVENGKSHGKANASTGNSSKGNSGASSSGKGGNSGNSGNGGKGGSGKH